MPIKINNSMTKEATCSGWSLSGCRAEPSKNPFETYTLGEN